MHKVWGLFWSILPLRQKINISPILTHISLEWCTVWRNASVFVYNNNSEYCMHSMWPSPPMAKPLHCIRLLLLFYLRFPRYLSREYSVCLTARIKLYLVLKCAIVHKVIRYKHWRGKRSERERKGLFGNVHTNIFTEWFDLITFYCVCCIFTSSASSKPHNVHCQTINNSKNNRKIPYKMNGYTSKWLCVYICIVKACMHFSLSLIPGQYEILFM